MRVVWCEWFSPGSGRKLSPKRPTPPHPRIIRPPTTTTPLIILVDQPCPGASRQDLQDFWMMMTRLRVKERLEQIQRQVSNYSIKLFFCICQLFANNRMESVFCHFCPKFPHQNCHHILISYQNAHNTHTTLSLRGSLSTHIEYNECIQMAWLFGCNASYWFWFTHSIPSL